MLPIPILSLLLGTSAYALSIKDYAPTVGVKCPSSALVRVFSAENQTLHASETQFIEDREEDVNVAWKAWMGDGSNVGYDNTEQYQKAPKVGIALSGGSFRAALFGAGVLEAFDSRNGSSVGGLLQVASYVSALSGGSWLTSSLYANGWPTIQNLVFGNEDKGLSGWLLDLNLFFPANADFIDVKNVLFYADIIESVVAKQKTGIDTSLTDPWSRALSYHFLNQTTRDNFFTEESSHGAGHLWSDITFSKSFLDRSAPFPIIMANSRPNNDRSRGILDQKAPVYEFSPLEFVSFDPSLSAAMDLKFMGSSLLDGKPVDSNKCVEGLDETGFVMGTSSSLFNKFIDDANSDLLDDTDWKVLKHLLSTVLESVRTRDDDVANWPNPFKGIASDTYVDTKEDWLELIDGGSNGEIIPIGPLLVKAREVDVIVAVDGGSNDDNDWPTGVSLLFAENRTSTLLQSSHQQLPPMPGSEADFVNAGFNQRPTFFGCNPTQNPPEYPMVLYFPNSPPVNGDDPATNTPTVKLGYTIKHQQVFLDQTYRNTVGGFIPDKKGSDSNFGKCLQCAIFDRARLQVDQDTNAPISRSDLCESCFKQYCYDDSKDIPLSNVKDRKLEFKDPDPQKKTFQLKWIIVAGVVGLLLIAGAITIIVCCCKRLRKSKDRGKYHALAMIAW